MWAAVPRCVQVGRSDAGRGGSGHCFYQRGFEMDREATGRYVSSPVSADTTLPPPRLPPGQHKRLLEEMPLQRGRGHPGPRVPSSRSHPSTPLLTMAKPSSGWIYRQDFPLYSQSFSQFFAFLPHTGSKEPPTHRVLEGRQHPSHGLAPTDRQHPRDTDATNTPCTGMDKGVSTLCRSQILHFPSEIVGLGLRLRLTSCTGLGGGRQVGREILTQLRLSKI